MREQDLSSSHFSQNLHLAVWSIRQPGSATPEQCSWPLRLLMSRLPCSDLFLLLCLFTPWLPEGGTLLVLPPLSPPASARGLGGWRRTGCHIASCQPPAGTPAGPSDLVGAQEQRNRLATRPFPHEGGGSRASLGHHPNSTCCCGSAHPPSGALQPSGETIELRAPFLIQKTMKTSAHREQGSALGK